LGLVIVALIALPLLAQDEPNKKKTATKPGAQAAQDDAGAKPAGKDDTKTKKTSKKKDEEKTTEKTEKFVYGANFSGRLKEMDANSQKNFTVEVQIPQPNPDGIQAMVRAEVDYKNQQAQILVNVNLNALQKRQQLAQAAFDYQRRVVDLRKNTVKYVPKDIPMKAADNIKVRSYSPPLDYDDKGNVKKYNPRELAKLRGKEKLPGYPAEFEALRAGQYVQVYLPKNQASPVPKAPKVSRSGKVTQAGKGTPIKLDSPEDDASISDRRLEAVMILIMAEPKNR
jgi:hypothetical protein